MTARGRPSPVQEEYARLAASYDRRWSSYIESSVRETLARLDLPAGCRLLDVGCGTGALLRAAFVRQPRLRAAGVDLTWEMIAVARRRLGGEALLSVADAVRLPFRAGVFDVVVSTSSLHFWEDPIAGLKEIGRVLRPGGRLVITDWCDDYVACRVCDVALRLVSRSHRRSYGGDELSGFLREACLEAITVDRYKIGWLWGLMTATAIHPA